MKLEKLLFEAVQDAKNIDECGGCERSNDWTQGHDHEGSMAKSELKDMLMNGAVLYKMLGENDQLPGWVSAYITLASDYIHSVTEHLAGKMSEPEMHDEIPSFAIYENNDTTGYTKDYKKGYSDGYHDKKENKTAKF